MPACMNVLKVGSLILLLFAGTCLAQAEDVTGSDSGAEPPSRRANTEDLIITPIRPMAPVASFPAGPHGGPAPLKVSFVDESTRIPTSWKWTFGDASTSAEQNPVHTFTEVGSYDVSLTVTNDSGSNTMTRKGCVQVGTMSLTTPTSHRTPGQWATVTWNTTGFTMTTWDWVGLYKVGDPSDDSYLAAAGDRWLWNSTGATPASFTVKMPMPDPPVPTAYEFRYFRQVTCGNLLATSNPVTVAPLFYDSFDKALSGWTLTGAPDRHSGAPTRGSHSLRLLAAATSGIDQGMEKTISTSGYSNITVSFWMGASGLDLAGEGVGAWWYDGTTWHLLRQTIGGDAENDGDLHHFQYTLPSEANNNSEFKVKFAIWGSADDDEAYLDDVIVNGQ
jgi:PKD repeat protein